MKKFFIILIIPLLIGCITTQRHVSQMYDWELQDEYNNLEVKHMQLERRMRYDRPSYMYMPLGNSFMALPMGTDYVGELTKIEERQEEVINEMSKRGILP